MGNTDIIPITMQRSCTNQIFLAQTMSIYIINLTIAVLESIFGMLLRSWQVQIHSIVKKQHHTQYFPTGTVFVVWGIACGNSRDIYLYSDYV